MPKSLLFSWRKIHLPAIFYVLLNFLIWAQSNIVCPRMGGPFSKKKLFMVEQNCLGKFMGGAVLHGGTNDQIIPSGVVS